MKKKMIILIIMKKNFWAKIVFGLLPSYIVKNIKLYCNIKILLQAIGCRKIFVLQGLRRDYIAIGKICIARLEGYCRMGKEEIELQYSGVYCKRWLVQGEICIVTKGQAAGVSCDTVRSRAHDTALARAALGHDTAVGPATRAGQGAQGTARGSAGRGERHYVCDTALGRHDTAA